MGLEQMLRAVSATLIAFHLLYTFQESGAQTMQVNESALVKDWPGTYGGVPPWHLVRTDEFVQAFEHLVNIKLSCGHYGFINEA